MTSQTKTVTAANTGLDQFAEIMRQQAEAVKRKSWVPTNGPTWISPYENHNSVTLLSAPPMAQAYTATDLFGQ